MAHLVKKNINGHEYFYAVETARVNGKSKVVKQVYLGSLDKITATMSGQSVPAQDVARFSVQEYGALWLANLIDKEIDIVGIVDSIVKRKRRTKTPSVGEYFLYAVFNRMIGSTSKEGLPEWYRKTAINDIRPVQIEALDADGYLKAWQHVSEEQIEEIAKAFFEKIAQAYPSKSEGCYLFDTTNYFTFMSGKTKSNLARTGNNKEGRYWLRQVGLALLVDRENKLPFFYKEYAGNRHDSKVFQEYLHDMLTTVHSHGKTEVTFVFDKGMNAEANFSIFDEIDTAHFVTTYSPYFSEALTHIDRKKFERVDCRANAERISRNHEEDCILAYRTEGEYWGKKRTVIVTYNPLTASKQRYAFDQKNQKLISLFDEIKENLKTSKRKVSAEKYRHQYEDMCEALHLPSNLYELKFEEKNGRLTFSHKKDQYRFRRYLDRHGINIIITDRTDWSSQEIVQASLDRYIVEDAFRMSKNEEQVSIFPIRHWTDHQISCHILTCIMALTYLKVIEMKIKVQGYEITSHKIMQDMQKLHQVLTFYKKTRKVTKGLEEADENQSQILKAFGYKIDGYVLQKV